MMIRVLLLTDMWIELYKTTTKSLISFFKTHIKCSSTVLAFIDTVKTWKTAVCWLETPIRKHFPFPLLQ